MNKMEMYEIDAMLRQLNCDMARLSNSIFWKSINEFDIKEAVRIANKPVTAERKEILNKLYGDITNAQPLSEEEIQNLLKRETIYSTVVEEITKQSDGVDTLQDIDSKDEREMISNLLECMKLIADVPPQLLPDNGPEEVKKVMNDIAYIEKYMEENK